MLTSHHHREEDHSKGIDSNHLCGSPQPIQPHPSVLTSFTPLPRRCFGSITGEAHGEDLEDVLSNVSLLIKKETGAQTGCRGSGCRGP